MDVFPYVLFAHDFTHQVPGPVCRVVEPHSRWCQFAGACVSRRGRAAVFAERAAGAHMWDVDGNEYIDYVGTWGPAILGHANPAIIEANKTGSGQRHQFWNPHRGRGADGEVGEGLRAERGESADG